MNREQQDHLFRRGLALCRKGALDDSIILFRRLIDSGSDEPVHLSYYGLLTTLVSGNRQLGLSLCDRALRFGTDEPQVLINVASVYERIGQPTKAIKMLRRGLRQTPGHKGMLKLIDKLSPRKQPPLSFVDRNNPVNKALAVTIAKVTGKLSDEDQPQRERATAVTS